MKTKAKEEVILHNLQISFLLFHFLSLTLPKNAETHDPTSSYHSRGVESPKLVLFPDITVPSVIHPTLGTPLSTAISLQPTAYSNSSNQVWNF